MFLESCLEDIIMLPKVYLHFCCGYRIYCGLSYITFPHIHKHVVIETNRSFLFRKS